METNDLKTMDGVMTYIVATYFKSMSNFYYAKLNKKESEHQNELTHATRFVKALNEIDENYSEFLKKEYITCPGTKWWFIYLTEQEYNEIKKNSLKAFFKAFSL